MGTRNPGAELSLVKYVKMKVNLFKILKQLLIESKETFPFSEQRHHTHLLFRFYWVKLQYEINS